MCSFYHRIDVLGWSVLRHFGSDGQHKRTGCQARIYLSTRFAFNRGDGALLQYIKSGNIAVKENLSVEPSPDFGNVDPRILLQMKRIGLEFVDDFDQVGDLAAGKTIALTPSCRD